ncbi:MAG: hypothetical protein WCJ29_01535 [bacterium]
MVHESLDGDVEVDVGDGFECAYAKVLDLLPEVRQMPAKDFLPRTVMTDDLVTTVQDYLNKLEGVNERMKRERAAEARTAALKDMGVKHLSETIDLLDPRVQQVAEFPSPLTPTYCRDRCVFLLRDPARLEEPLIVVGDGFLDKGVVCDVKNLIEREAHVAVTFADDVRSEIRRRLQMK